MKPIIRSMIFSMSTLAALLIPSTVDAEIHSRSKNIVVMEAHNLPEAAQLPGNSFFLHAGSDGSTYLYIEQQQGARLSVFDVTDPGRIRLASTTELDVSGPFDFAGPLNGRAALVRFRDGNRVGVLDLHKATRPQLRMIPAFAADELTERLGPTGILAVQSTYTYAPAAASNFEVVDVSRASAPVLLATIKDVKHRTVNEETGTTFLLGSNGLTVVRRLDVEDEYKVHQLQMQGN
jgi:hypothetical protein